MEFYVAHNGDYVFMISSEEFGQLEEDSLEGELKKEKGGSCEKTGKLSFKPSLTELITFMTHPEGAKGDRIETVELILNQEGYDDFFYAGEVVQDGENIDLYVQKYDP